MKYHYFKKHAHKLIYVANMSITRHRTCHLGKQRHIGHSYNSPESGRQYINQPPQLSHAGKEQPTRLNWWQVGCQILEKSIAHYKWKTALHSNQLKHLKLRVAKKKHIWSTDYVKHPAKKTHTQKVSSLKFQHFAVGNL